MRRSRVPLRVQARLEYEKAITWYETQRIGLGDQFAEAVEEIFEKIEEQPDRFPIELGDVREAQVLDWPYVVYYQIREKRILVLSVFHTSQDPAKWQERI